MNNEEKISAGDIVRLKSGGPVMVVRDNCTTAGGDWDCSWSVDGGHKKGSFTTEELRLATESEIQHANTRF